MKIKSVVLLVLVVLCFGCVKKDTPKKEGNLCLDKTGQVITGYSGNPLKADSKMCARVLEELDYLKQSPCRNEEGQVLYDEMGRPFPEDFCEEARKLIADENALEAKQASGAKK